MTHSETIKTLAAALVKAQAELSNVIEDTENPFFKSMYAPLDKIIDHVKPVLAKNGLCVIQGNSKTDTGIVVNTLLLHESGEWIESELNMPLSKNDPQGAGSAITYGRRYALSAILGISSGQDDDANVATHTNHANHTPTYSADKPMSPAQKSHLWELMKKTGKTVDEVANHAGVKVLSDLSIRQASQTIDWLNDTEPVEIN